MLDTNARGFADFVSATGYAIEAVGVVVIVIGALLATFKMFGDLRGPDKANLYQNYRKRLAQSMMLGLEFLVDFREAVCAKHFLCFCQVMRVDQVRVHRRRRRRRAVSDDGP